MCSLMITQNLSITDLLFVEKVSGNTIFHKICSLGHLKLMKFLESVMSRKEFIDQMFVPNNFDIKCIEYAMRYSQPSIAKNLLEMDEIQDRYKNNDPMIFRLCFYLFVDNSNLDLTDYVLSALQISKEKVVQMMGYRCPRQPGFKQGYKTYHYFSIMGRVILWGSFGHLQRLFSFIGKQAFIDNFFNLDAWNVDAMYYAVIKKNMKIIEYILSMDEIKKKFMSDDNALFRLVSALNENISDKDVVQYIVDALSLTEAKLSELNAFRNIDISQIIPFTK